HKPIQAPSVRNAHLLPQHPHLGYLRISTFDPDTHIELKNAIEMLIQKKAHALIIDLRANGGGILQTAVQSADLFLDHETIVTVQSEQNKKIYRAVSYPQPFRLPIALLVDQHTASAAELFSRALKNNKRAAVFGYDTFGKNLVQTIYHLNDHHTAICLTTASFIPPHPVNPLHSKITPDRKPDTIDDPWFAQSTLDFLSQENPVLNLAVQWCSTSALFGS
ncbi:MAG: hypothetical protein IID32_11595, partial [Planctomycetes bacterium]|nr:hypothetical protein [Planctomycetota bacterium]